MSALTPRERLLRALRRQEPDRVPCHLAAIRWIRSHYGSASPRQQLRFADDFGFDLIIPYGSYTGNSVTNDYIYTPGGGFGYSCEGFYGDLQNVHVEMRIENRPDEVIYRRVFATPAGKLSDVIQWARPGHGYGDGPNPHRLEPLVKSEKDLEAYALLFSPPRRDVLAEAPLLLEDFGGRALLAATDAVHAGSWGLEALGPEGMLLASIENPALLKAVTEISLQAHLRNLRALLEQGFQAVYDSWFQCGPSVGWAPATYRDIFLPAVRAAVALAHEFEALYIYQDDGCMRDILPHMADAGVDAASGLQPPDVGDVVLKEAKQAHGSRMALIGGLDPCYTFDMGSPEKVRAAVRRAIADAGEGGGYILCTAESIDPQTSPECLNAAVAAAREYGDYTHA